MGKNFICLPFYMHLSKGANDFIHRIVRTWFLQTKQKILMWEKAKQIFTSLLEMQLYVGYVQATVFLLNIHHLCPFPSCQVCAPSYIASLPCKPIAWSQWFPFHTFPILHWIWSCRSSCYFRTDISAHSDPRMWVLHSSKSDPQFLQICQNSVYHFF